MTENMFLNPKRDYVTIEGIFQKDYLNLVLVANDLKPATMITMEIPEKNYIKKMNAKIDEISETIKNMDLMFNFEIESPKNSDGIKVNLYASKNADILAKLSFYRLGDMMIGKLLGYPREAIDAYVLGKTSEQKIAKNIAGAIDAGTSIPAWYSYISHIPETFDPLNNDISQSSKKLGETYRNFIIKNYEGLYFVIDTEHSDYYSKKNITNASGNALTL